MNDKKIDEGFKLLKLSSDEERHRIIKISSMDDKKKKEKEYTFTITKNTSADVKEDSDAGLE